MKARGPRYAPASRLHELRVLLDSAQGVSLYEVAERFEVSTKTALRYLHALRTAGEPLYEEIVGRRKVWRLVAATIDNLGRVAKALELRGFATHTLSRSQACEGSTVVDSRRRPATWRGLGTLYSLRTSVNH